jgi:undecaprenyl diphosphate synthase
MGIMMQSLNDETETLLKNNIKLTAIGDLDRLDAEVRNKLSETIEMTSVSTGLRLVVALSYSSRWEILRATRRIASEVKEGVLDVNSIDDALFGKYLCTADLPDPDLVIRTSGEKRISNFLLWQSAYAEFYFTDILWPDFGKDDFYNALIDFQKRERRFGKTSEQISEK